jgi:hypothetical protein
MTAAYYPGSHRITMRYTGDRDTGRLVGVQLVGHRDAEIAKRIDCPTPRRWDRRGRRCRPARRRGRARRTARISTGIYLQASIELMVVNG